MNCRDVIYSILIKGRIELFTDIAIKSAVISESKENLPVEK